MPGGLRRVVLAVAECCRHYSYEAGSKRKLRLGALDVGYACPYWLSCLLLARHGQLAGGTRERRLGGIRLRELRLREVRLGEVRLRALDVSRACPCLLDCLLLVWPSWQCLCVASRCSWTWQCRCIRVRENNKMRELRFPPFTVKAAVKAAVKTPRCTPHRHLSPSTQPSHNPSLRIPHLPLYITSSK